MSIAPAIAFLTAQRELRSRASKDLMQQLHQQPIREFAASVDALSRSRSDGMIVM
jgi:hypothetical protein